MLMAVTLGITILFTGYVMILTHRYKKKLTCMTAMMIAMTAAMMSSLVLGTLVGTLTDGQMLLPTVVAMVFGMIVGYFTGIPISLMAALDGVMAGIMGGMMGAMLGVMVIYQQPELTIAFMDLVFLLVMTLLVRMIREEARVEKISRKSLLIMVPLVLVLLFLMGKEIAPFSSVADGRTPELPTVVQARQNIGYQEAEIRVETAGYSVDELRVKAGVPLKLHFRKEYEGGCLTTLKIPDFNVQKKLSVGTTTVEFTPTKTGKYAFMCGMNMYGGYITVE